LEFGQAQRAGLNIAMVGMADGSFSTPEKASIMAAVDAAGLSADTHFATSLINSKAKGAYPISALTYVIMRRNSSAAVGHSRALRFFSYVYENSGNTALELGFVPMPEKTAKDVTAYWSRAFRNGS
jgi:phosphate transport system substrate-binding protein